MKSAKPIDLALEKVDQKLFNHPEAIKQLTKLEKHFSNIERIKEQLKRAEAAFNEEAKAMSNILDLLMLSRYELPGKNFYVKERIYRDVKIQDKAAFMAWLKENCKPQEVLELLTPPTKLTDLKKFVEYKLENDCLEIPGILTNNTFTVLKGYRNDKEENYKKGSNEISGYQRERKSDYKTSKRKRPDSSGRK